MSEAAIALAADHAGYELKETLRQDLEAAGYRVLDLGPHSDDSVDYPLMADRLAEALADGRAGRGVLVCGSGIGISIAANRHPHVRAALCSEPVSARLAREHNDANVIAFGGRLVGSEVARECLKVFLATAFAGGERHSRRVGQLGSGGGQAGG